MSEINVSLIPLDWDTEYFKVPSARVILHRPVSSDDCERILDFASTYEFVTITNQGDDKMNNRWLGEATTAFLTDVNLQFEMNVTLPQDADPDTLVSSSLHRDEEIIAIASSSFRYSRFFNDPYLPQPQAGQIYLNWTKNAFEREDKFFIVTKRQTHVAGYTLFSVDEKEKKATIELIAVAKEYQSQHVGKSMVDALNRFAVEHQLQKIHVGTQADNIDGIRFYTRVGFQPVSCASVYHYWPKRIVK